MFSLGTAAPQGAEENTEQRNVGTVIFLSLCRRGNVAHVYRNTAGLQSLLETGLSKWPKLNFILIEKAGAIKCFQDVSKPVAGCELLSQAPVDAKKLKYQLALFWWDQIKVAYSDCFSYDTHASWLFLPFAIPATTESMRAFSWCTWNIRQWFLHVCYQQIYNWQAMPQFSWTLWNYTAVNGWEFCPSQKCKSPLVQFSWCHST